MNEKNLLSVKKDTSFDKIKLKQAKTNTQTYKILFRSIERVMNFG